MQSAASSLDVGVEEPCGLGPHGQPRRRSLLIVDDDASVADGLAFLVTGEGYDVEIAADANAAAQVLDRRRFDAVLTDLSMPGGGRRWLARLRATRPHMTVVVITALEAEAAVFATVFATSAHLADAVLGKPVEAGVLFDLLDNFLPVVRA